ncbi:MAG: two-component system sensor histidine kinase CreC [Methylococcales bacterium]
MSIRRRIFLGIILLFSVGFYFLIDFIVDDIELRYRESTEEPLVDTARVLAAIASSSVVDKKINIDLFRQSFKHAQSQVFSAQIFGLEKNRVDLHVYMTDQIGMVIFDSNDGQDEGQDYSEWRDVFYTLFGEYGARTSPIDENDDAEDKKMLYIASPILLDNQLIGVLSVGKPTHSSSQFIQAAQKKLIIGGTAVCLTLIAIGLLLGVWVTQPIQQLTNYARGVRDGKRVKRPILGSNEMEELSIAFEQMRDALDGKSYVENYVQTLTHEIKSPVSAIRGAVELLEEDLSPLQKQTFLQNIHLESERISQIVDNLLLLSALESRKYINTLDTIAVQEMFNEIEQTLTPVLLVKNINLMITGDTDCEIHGESNLIRQALMNIIQNAIDFSPSDTSIKLCVSSKNTGVQFEVHDQGPGIPEYACERIFERFYSLKRPQSGRKSSGLGLSLVQEIVSLHQGTISVENHPNGGTVARLFFPGKLIEIAK